MWIPVLLFTFGVIAIVKGEFKITSERKVRGFVSRFLGALMLGASILVFTTDFGGEIAIGVFISTIIVGLITSEKDETMQTKQQSKKEYLGISPGEMGILVVLIIVICVIGGFLGKMILDNPSTTSLKPAVIHEPTYTIAPSITPSQIPPSRLTSTPMPGWNRFEFAEGKAEIWLPESYQGGDTVAYPDVVIMTLETYIDDDVFVESVKPIILESDTLFFAFDTEPADAIRFVYVIVEQLPPDLIISMNDYLNAVSDYINEDNTRIVGRETKSLDYYSDVGVLTTEVEIPAGEGVYFYVRLCSHVVRVDNTMWGLFFRTSRTEFDEYLSTIDRSVRTFYVNP